MLSQLFIKKELTGISGNTQPPPPFLYGQSDQWIPHFDSCQLTTTWMCNIRLQAITLYLFIYHPTKKCGMIRLTPWQKLLFFYGFSNSWSLMSHCSKVKFLLNRPTSICIKSRYWQRGLWGIHKFKTKEIILRLRNE